MSPAKTLQFYLSALISLTLLYCSINATAQFKITDTIYYNAFWRICEKPVASFYRAGILAGLNEHWYYTGDVKDYKMDNTLIMSGAYNNDGSKQGDFTFYYADGKLMAEGKYKNGRMIEKWNWYYPNGNSEAVIDFSPAKEDFEFLKFNDAQGQSLLENGNGSFKWYSDPLDWEHTGYTFSGSYQNGSRAGTWQFDSYPKKEIKKPGFRLKYAKAERLKTNEYDYAEGIGRYKMMLLYSNSYKLITTERILFDDLFRVNGDSTARNALIDYLLTRKQTEVDLRYKVFNVAFNTILKKLEYYKYKLHFKQDRDVNCKLEFKIGSKGFLEDIHFDGSGIDIDEMNFFTYLLGKFRHVEMPGDQNVGMETNYTIYVFSLDFKELIPDNAPADDTKDLGFSFKPREKVEKYLHDNRDEIKKMNKDKKESYYQDSNH